MATCVGTMVHTISWECITGPLPSSWERPRNDAGDGHHQYTLAEESWIIVVI